MLSTLLPIFLAVVVVFMITAFSRRFVFLRYCYHYGISSWSNWLPVVSTASFLMILFFNLMFFGQMNRWLFPISLGNLFSFSETIILFFIGSMFLTKQGNIVAISVVSYCLTKYFIVNSHFIQTAGLNVILATSTIVAVLGDRLPWYQNTVKIPCAKVFRELALFFITAGAFLVILMVMFKLNIFSHWIGSQFHVAFSPFVIIFLLSMVFIGWVAVALGSFRNFILPVICLPTIFALAFLTRWPPFILVVPFAACLALSLTTAERRVIPRLEAVIQGKY